MEEFCPCYRPQEGKSSEDKIGRSEVGGRAAPDTEGRIVRTIVDQLQRLIARRGLALRTWLSPGSDRTQRLAGPARTSVVEIRATDA